MLKITERQSNAALKNFGSRLRALGIDNPRQFSPHSFEWKRANEAQREVRRMAREAIELAEKAGDDEARVAEANDAYNAAMELDAEFDEEKDYRTQIGNRDARADADRPDPRRPQGQDGEGRMDGGWDHGTEEVVEQRGLRHDQRFAEPQSGNGEFNRLGLGRYLRAMTTGAKSDLEKRALAEGSDSSGGFTVPTVLSARLIDLVRARNQAMAAGAVTMPLSSDKHHIAKVMTDPEPGWEAESDEGAESEPTFGRVQMEPKTLRVIVRASREVLQDSLNIETELPNIIAAAMAKELDRVCFLGTGEGQEPAGLDTIPGVQTLPFDGPIENYGVLVKARKQLMREDAQVASQWVMHPDVEADFGGLVDANGQPLNHPNILDRPDPMRMLTTTKLPTDLGDGSNESTIYGGDFSQLVVGIRNDVRIEVLRERYADQFEYGFLAFMRADVAAIRAEHLLRITGVLAAS